MLYHTFLISSSYISLSYVIPKDEINPVISSAYSYISRFLLHNLSISI